MCSSMEKKVAENCYPALFTSTNFHMKKILPKINVIQQMIWFDAAYKGGQESESTMISVSPTVARVNRNLFL